MSITKDFNTAMGKYSRQDVVELLAHARACESMLEKHEWSSIAWGVPGCPDCMNQEQQGHKPDCQLAKLLEGVE